MSSTALRELRSLRVRHLAELPAKPTLTVRLGQGDRAVEVLFTASRARATRAADEGVPCCSPLEYEALAAAVEVEAVDVDEVLALIERKRAPLGYRLTLEDLVGAARHPDGRTITCPVRRRPLLRVELGRHVLGEGTSLTVGELLDALQAQLVAVEVEGEAC